MNKLFSGSFDKVRSKTERGSKVENVSEQANCKMEWSIVKWALASRLLVFLLQFVANALIPDHDAHVFIYPKANLTQSVFDSAVDVLLGGFIRWDAQYFVHIARYGYTYENIVAFFPFYPVVVGYISRAASCVFIFSNLDTLTVLVYLSFNVIVFVRTVLVLFELTCKVKDVDFAYKTSLLFCFNPASIFFTAPYTECLFFYLTLKSLASCIDMYVGYLNAPLRHLRLKSALPCVFFVGLSACTRSNGILNAGFFLYFYVKACVFQANRLGEGRLAYTINAALLLVAYACVMLLPFALVQLYDYVWFCTDFEANLPQFLEAYGIENDLVLPGRFSKYGQSWCYKVVPLAYSYVQEHYWHVGFLKYYELKQIPNFALALPVVAIVFRSAYGFFKDNADMLLHVGVFRLWSRRIPRGKAARAEFWLSQLRDDVFFVSNVHLVALTVFCVLCVNVQVTTRMLFSASAAIYWFCCQYFVGTSREQKFIEYYFMSYFAIGTILFCNFLPWT